mmetsp:Transcript_140564/g.448088  ORF Transcript_140564/g.448088 Transcript_140564/m.448088 type:complete len:256 (-) Transcript_140564:141-908(-)
MAGGRRSSSWMFGRPLPLSSRSLGDRSICSRSSRSNRSSSCCRSNHCSPGSRRSPVGQSPLRLPHRHRLLCLVTRAAQLRMLAAGGPEVKTTPSQHGLGPWRTGLPAAAADLPRSIHSTVGGRRWLPMMVPVRRLRRPREHLAPCPRHVGSARGPITSSSNDASARVFSGCRPIDVPPAYGGACNLAFSGAGSCAGDVAASRGWHFLHADRSWCWRCSRCGRRRNIPVLLRAISPRPAHRHSGLRASHWQRDRQK